MYFENIRVSCEALMNGSGHEKINDEVDTADKHAAGERRRGKDQNGEKKEKSGRYRSTRPPSKEKENRQNEKNN